MPIVHFYDFRDTPELLEIPQITPAMTRFVINEQGDLRRGIYYHRGCDHLGKPRYVLESVELMGHPEVP